MLSPVICGSLFGTRALAGLLAGALVSGVQMAVSMSNTGGAWDNAKKYIEVRSSVCCCCYMLILTHALVPVKRLH
jgi:inorganic pyrophosphatase